MCADCNYYVECCQKRVTQSLTCKWVEVFCNRLCFWLRLKRKGESTGYPYLNKFCVRKLSSFLFLHNYFLLQITIDVSIFFRLFCDTGAAFHVFLRNVARKNGARPARIDPLAHTRRLTAVLPASRPPRDYYYILGISHAAYQDYLINEVTTIWIFLMSYGFGLVSNNNFLATNPLPKIFTKRFKLPNPLLLAWETDFLHNVIGNEQLFWRKISATWIKRGDYHIRYSAYKTT